ncbi:hypothetical protein BBP40_001276 [Aspergillus hancockii]|nr:hypothetical protein BBP40_001276 [Aspergillus hancockii]
MSEASTFGWALRKNGSCLQDEEVDCGVTVSPFRPEIYGDFVGNHIPRSSDGLYFLNVNLAIGNDNVNVDDTFRFITLNNQFFRAHERTVA